MEKTSREAFTPDINTSVIITIISEAKISFRIHEVAYRKIVPIRKGVPHIFVGTNTCQYLYLRINT